MQDASGNDPESCDVICLGETMLLLTPAVGTALTGRPPLSMNVGGAESNVACALAQLGHRAAWWSRVGDDPFGELISKTIGGYGVDISRIEVDQDRHTGIYVKDPAPDGTKVYYYRAGSAAAGMTPAFGETVLTSRVPVIHLSGITPALSESCAALTEYLLSPRSGGKPLRSFDVNYRPALWNRATAAEALLPLARAADVVFVGLDEAEELWSTGTMDSVRNLLPNVGTLVVKDAENGATCYENGTRTHVSALPVEIVEPVGAGDAFAAGFLSGLLRGKSAQERLRLGHLVAAQTLVSTGDVVELPYAAAFDHALGASGTDWPGVLTRQGPGTTQPKEAS